jgi:hypothetical protein
MPVNITQKHTEIKLTPAAIEVTEAPAIKVRPVVAAHTIIKQDNSPATLKITREQGRISEVEII